MWQYALIILFFVAAIPLVPHFLTGADKEDQVAESSALVEDPQDAGDAHAGRVHKVPSANNGGYLTEARINGRSLTMLIDTGASQIVLPEREAHNVGIFLQSSDFKVPVQTANGVTYGAPTVVRELKLGSIRLKNIEALVLKDEALAGSLLGMSALSRLKRFYISNDTMVLIQ
jgi:aspartyl protease family protein